MNQQEDFLKLLYPECLRSQHIFPDYACCEAALETAWGNSRLFKEGKNVFGQKAGPFTSQYETLIIPTQEFINGQWVTINAEWVKFPTLSDSFKERMNLLERLRHKYSEYDAALLSKTGEEFIINVSKRWSTDPLRGVKVLNIYKAYNTFFIIDHTAPTEQTNPDSFWAYLLNKLNLK